MDCHTQRQAFSLPKQHQKSRKVCSPCSWGFQFRQTRNFKGKPHKSLLRQRQDRLMVLYSFWNAFTMTSVLILNECTWNIHCYLKTVFFFFSLCLILSLFSVFCSKQSAATYKIMFLFAVQAVCSLCASGLILPGRNEMGYSCRLTAPVQLQNQLLRFPLYSLQWNMGSWQIQLAERQIKGLPCVQEEIELNCLSAQ